jgi:hypothetical protein
MRWRAIAVPIVVIVRSDGSVGVMARRDEAVYSERIRNDVRMLDRLRDSRRSIEQCKRDGYIFASQERRPSPNSPIHHEGTHELRKVYQASIRGKSRDDLLTRALDGIAGIDCRYTGRAQLTLAAGASDGPGPPLRRGDVIRP